MIFKTLIKVLKMDYPLKKNFLDIEEILSLAINYKPIYITSKNKKKLDILKQISSRKYREKLSKYNGDYLIIVSDDNSKFHKMNSLTDFFSEECRVKCRTEGFKYSPYDSYMKNYEEILRKTENIYGEITDKNVNKYMERFGMDSRICNNYKLTFLTGILEHFKPKRWLDLSAGWGDRLISAILKDVDYYIGIDPNPCLEPCYKSIIKTLAAKDKQKNYKVVKDKAESVDLPVIMKELKIENFDLIFTSPPFFTFEIYSEAEGQSVVSYNTVDLWLNNFLFKSIDNSWDKLQKNGHYVLYIADKPEYRYIDKLLKFMNKKEDCVYKGIIYQSVYNNKYPTYQQYLLKSVYVWTKI